MSDDFNPDWGCKPNCVAREALREHLAHCPNKQRAAEPETRQDAAHYAWLIECNVLWDEPNAKIIKYWCGEYEQSGSQFDAWTDDAHKAIRFSRKEDAEKVLVRVVGTKFFPYVAEHGFDRAALQTAPYDREKSDILIEEARDRLVNCNTIFTNLLKGNQPNQGFQKWIDKNYETIKSLNDYIIAAPMNAEQQEDKSNG